MRRLLAACALALLVFAPGAGAQVSDTPTDTRDLSAPAASAAGSDARFRAGVALDGVAQAGAIDPAQYILGPGDVLKVRLWGRVAREQLLEVDPEGFVHPADVEPVRVAGQSLTAARNAVLDRVSRLFRGVNLDVHLVRMRHFKVYLTGEVRVPGACEVTPVSRLSEAVAIIGLQERASRRNITVRRVDGMVVVADLVRFETTGDPSRDPVLRDGDIVEVPVATRFVSANGAFARPGRFELGPDDSLATLLRLAGGALPSADMHRASIIRFDSPTARETLAVDLSPGAAALDAPLRDGDAAFVTYQPDYHRLPTVAVVGEVQSPGAYAIELGRDRLADLVRWAGGFRPRADLTNLLVVRHVPDAGEVDSEFDRLVHLSRDQMTESEYSRLQTELAERKNSFRVDWKRLQGVGERHDLDLLLVDGDLLRVDPLVTSVRIDGQVRNPGLVEYVPGRPISDYIRLAGGYTNRASRGGARVTRRGTGQVVSARSAKDLGPGDVLWVPEVHDHDFWAIFREVLGAGAQVAVIVVAVHSRN